ncbi:protein kinase domain-containing protein [Paraglaciecola sp.]|uniref:protein kinase domain-containing protein n=1 Tax=Paraglaciecola sp. TaxID=1920173 RepID=UPI003EF6D06C
MADNMLDKTIGRYEIKEMIGEGAMAKVYRAYDPEINRSVAFKILKEDHCVDDEYLSRFLREAKAAGALSHSSIVTVYDVGKLEKSPYIMMELLDGCDLGEVLQKKKILSLKQTLVIGLQLAKALDYAHKSGIVHRDVKPDNIIVLPDGESIKVADFGIARMNENEEAQKTQVGSVLGTPRYMSPEQALGDSVDGRSDLFSVGVILYEMLSGMKAFDASNMGTLMIQIAQKQPEPLKKLRPELPAGVRQIIQKLLQKSPDKRFQTGADLAAALGKELNTLRDEQDEQKKQKYLPLKIRWTLSVGAIVALVSFISINVVFNMQSSAMTKQAVDSGASFAKFISTETAIPLLSEDWITLETFINDAASRDTFSYLIVTDRVGIIRGASDTSLVGQKYAPDESAELISETEDVHTTSSETEDGHKVFNINTPILFQSTEVGEIVLGLSQDSLDEVKSITGWLMFILALITTSSVAVVMFIFGGLIARPFKVLNQSLKSFASGNLDTRISLTRNDEIGEVFDCFNNMATSVQERYTSVADELEQTGVKVAKLEQSQINGPEVESEKPTTPEAEATPEDLSALENTDATIIASSLINIKKTKLKKESDSNLENQSEDQTIISSSLITEPKAELEEDVNSESSNESPENKEKEANPVVKKAPRKPRARKVKAKAKDGSAENSELSEKDNTSEASEVKAGKPETSTKQQALEEITNTVESDADDLDADRTIIKPESK